GARPGGVRGGGDLGRADAVHGDVDEALRAGAAAAGRGGRVEAIADRADRASDLRGAAERQGVDPVGLRVERDHADVVNGARVARVLLEAGRVDPTAAVRVERIRRRRGGGFD